MFLSLCWLLVAISYKADGRVDNDFRRCSQFFFKNKMPVGFEGIAKNYALIPDGITNTGDLASPAYICQTLGGHNHYATLYDRGRRIALYSAYILDRKRAADEAKCTRVSAFQLEPQLIFRELTENMLSITDLKQKILAFHKEKKISERDEKNRQTNVIKASQAWDDDYKNAGYSKGHLNPCGHHMAKENYLSTFTLTNVVPMLAGLNNGAWSEYEKEMIGISAGCSKMYVVTGSIPGNNALKDRVTIPSYVWNAYCCMNTQGKPIKSGGAIAANDKALIKDNKFEVEKMELGDLQVKLKNLLDASKTIQIFACDCSVQRSKSCHF